MSISRLAATAARDLAVVVGGDDGGGATVLDGVLQLGVGMRRVQRHGDRAGVPAGQQGDDEVVAGRGDDGQPRSPGSYRACSAPASEAASRSIVGERPRPGRVDDRQAVAEAGDAVRQRLEDSSFIGSPPRAAGGAAVAGRRLQRCGGPQHADVVARRADELDADRQAVAVEAGREGQRRAAHHGDSVARRHPVDVRAQPAPADLGRVLPLGREWGELGHRADEQVVAGEELGAAPHEHAEVLVGRGDLGRGQLVAAADLVPDRRLELRRHAARAGPPCRWPTATPATS